MTNSIATTNLDDSLRDIKPPVEIPNALLWLFIGIGAVVLIGLIVLVWWLLKKNRGQVSAPPPIPPHVRAKQNLNAALELIRTPLPFCVLVSDTIRVYLEERFNFRAPERTTEEFLHELQSTNLLNTDQKSTLGKFLESCDLVKFAKYEPGEPELRELHSSAIRLVDETEPKPEPVQSPIADSQSPKASK